ncbi:glycosyltransferase [Pediococcus inopinatus]|uniref:glycosyltransferase family 32 protein n=1 Tax=Pediococcus inopinatus TaxID=114090 RepID=UPI002A6AF764|nr:glycosyltransferase [Pediococcus inopinatus]WPP08690.1 glycosyltransferase [Pediococcus inopinatus]
MIPKKVHYIWLGESMPESVVTAIHSWERPLSDYVIINWDEKKIQKYLTNSFVLKALKQKKYAFVSDYVRLRILYEYGGVYLDTDMVVKQKFDSFLKYKTFWGRMYSNAVGSGIIGSEPGNPMIKQMIDIYDNGHASAIESNNRLITRYFLKNFKDFSVKNKKQILGESNLLLPTYYLYLPLFFKKHQQYASHLFMNSWTNNSRNQVLISKLPDWIISIVRNKNGKKRFFDNIDYSKESEK